MISQTAFVPFGSLLVTATNASVAVWDTALVRPLGSAVFPGDGAAITGVAYSADGRWAAASSSLGPVELWHVTGGQPTGEPVLLSIDGPDSVTAIAFRPDGRRLVVGRSDGSIMSFDPATPEEPGRSVRVAGDGVTALAFAPGGAILAIAAEDGTIALMNPTNGSVRKVISSHPGGSVGGLAFSPDGSKLASSGADGRLIVDDVRDSGSTVLAVRTPETMNGVAYRPDGHAVAVADSGGLATVAQAPAGVRSAVLSPGGGAVEAVAFSPHGRLFATAAEDGTVRLWDPYTQQPVGTPLAGPVPGLRVLAFSPQGEEMVTGGRDGTIVFWSADPAAWAARLCDVVGRQLTRQEWAQLLPQPRRPPRLHHARRFKILRWGQNDDEEAKMVPHDRHHHEPHPGDECLPVDHDCPGRSWRDAHHRGVGAGLCRPPSAMLVQRVGGRVFHHDLPDSSSRVRQPRWPLLRPPARCSPGRRHYRWGLPRRSLTTSTAKRNGLTASPSPPRTFASHGSRSSTKRT